MKRLLALLLALLSAPAFAQSVVQTENVRAELLADASAIKPGEPFWVGLRQTIRPKWHTYWKNPGDSGLPTEITWKLPEGAKAEPIVWPRPHFFDLSGVINYGYHVDVDQAWERHDLPQQFRKSQQNAMFVVPEAPASLADAHLRRQCATS